MKKLFVAVAFLAVAGIAFGGTVVVPFFLDDGTTANTATFVPATGTAGFIGLLNATGGDLTLTFTYTDGSGADRTPAGNTYNLVAGGSAAFRPATIDAGIETPGVPTFTNPFDAQAVTGGGIRSGNAVIAHPGGPNDVLGRYVQLSAGGALAYLLPTF